MTDDNLKKLKNEIVRLERKLTLDKDELKKVILEEIEEIFDDESKFDLLIEAFKSNIETAKKAFDKLEGATKLINALPELEDCEVLLVKGKNNENRKGH